MLKTSRSHALVDAHPSPSSGAAPVRRRLLALLTALSLIVGLGAISMTPAAAEVGVDWTEQTASAVNNWMSVTYGNGVFVAVAYDGTDQVMTSPDGVNWTARSAALNIGWGSVTFGNGLFVALSPMSTNGQCAGGYGTDQVMTSPDGVTWTARLAADCNSWSSVTFGNGMFVAVGDRANAGTRVMTSPDGVNWTARTAPIEYLSSVTYGNGMFVAISYVGSNRVMTSPDGVTWTAQSAPEGFWYSVTYGNGTFVAVAPDSKVMTSPDGSTWTEGTPAAAEEWVRVTFGNGLFVAVGPYGAVMTSPDGFSWSRPSAPVSQWWSVTYGQGIFVAVSRSWGMVMTSGTPPPTVPSAPSSLVATPGDGSASIAFTPGSNGGAAIKKYQYKVGSGAWTDAVGTTSPITITGLTNYVASSVKIRAVNVAGAGAASAAVSVRPKVAGPAIGVAYSSGKHGAFVGFTFARPAGSTLVGFTVRAYAKGTNTVVSSCQVLPNGRNCYIGSLTSGTEYDIRVQGYLRLSGSSTVRATYESATSRVRINSGSVP